MDGPDGHRCKDPLPDAQAIARDIISNIGSCQGCQARFAVVPYASNAYVALRLGLRRVATLWGPRAL